MRRWCAATILIALPAVAGTQSKLPPEARRTFADPATYAPDLNDRASTSELRDAVPRYTADRQLLLRFHNVQGSAMRIAAQENFADGWLQALARLDFDRLSQEAKVDYILLANRIKADRQQATAEARLVQQLSPLVPFAQDMAALQEARQRTEFVAADAAVQAIDALTARVKSAHAALTGGSVRGSNIEMAEAAGQVDALRTALGDWFNFYRGYDPSFTATAPSPYQALNAALDEYVALLRSRAGNAAAVTFSGRGGPEQTGRGGGRGGGQNPGGRGAAPDVAQPLVLGEPITGTPAGRETLLALLEREMIVYTPEQLIEIGNREYAWTENEMKKASRDMGFGDNWRAALEKVKNAYVAPGGQPALVRNLALQAERFIRERDLLTVPPIVTDTWRMQMMSPQTMRTAPFFLGGESIQVSYPVVGMSEELATMIMKGNGPHLSHATVFHELIPGHGLQGYMAQRYNQHRSLFSTPFYGEGWALYLEMLMWDLGFHATPEDRIGALFWRMHRAARIVFTMNWQMGRWTPEQCVEFLVSNGHERYTAEGEVRGHIRNSPPLYQISYLMGALQLWSIYQDVVVQQKAMTAKQFNDRVLRGGSMPIEMVRALLTGQKLTRDYRAQWKFYGEVAAR
jgi:uncharacterized protein (DUF885 family)